MMHRGRLFVERGATIAIAAATLLLSLAPARAADPIKIGLSLSLTGATAPAGRQVQAGLDIWRENVNAAGGLLGRPVELIYYDDQARAMRSTARRRTRRSSASTWSTSALTPSPTPNTPRPRARCRRLHPRPCH